MQTTETLTLQGLSLIAGTPASGDGASFHGFNPANGQALAPEYRSATAKELEQAIAAAAEAAPWLAKTTGAQRATLLRHIADGIDANAQAIVEQAHLETALPLKPRLFGELARTSNQLRLFAQVIEEGSWTMARIETADPQRTPRKPDLRSRLRPLGPVVVFGASNFPLAFSVAGGDFASALAAGNPVIVKAHAAHPGTGELVGHIVTAAVAECGFPAGTFSLLYDSGFAIGAALVAHPLVQAVGFTGSLGGGRALMDIAAKRKQPIPVYAEMGSSNPIFILPGALQERAEALATGLSGSYTGVAGQVCTKPGLVFVGENEEQLFVDRLRALTADGPAFSLLTSGIAARYREQVAARGALTTATGAAAEAEGFAAQATLLETTYEHYVTEHSLAEEVFGPATLLIHCSEKDQMLAAARALDGHLTASIHGTEQDLLDNAELLAVLESKVGRVIFNGFPTGVEVNHAMVHGGPYPATSDGRSTSVGSQAIFRFARAVCYQDLPQSALPLELQDANPLGVLRLWNGKWSSGPGE